MNLLYSLLHLGYSIPPQADAGWIGEAGPGPSYLDEGSGGPENDFDIGLVCFSEIYRKLLNSMNRCMPNGRYGGVRGQVAH